MLHEIRRHGSLAKAELARVTELSTQTASVIINRLLEEQLVRKLEVQRGKVGQPSQPIALNPVGAYAIGIQIGRRTLKVVLVDLLGTVLERWELAYASPDVRLIFPAIEQQLAQMLGTLGPEAAARLCGVGVSAPRDFGQWEELLRMPAADAAEWGGMVIGQRVQAMTPLPVSQAKDTAAACMAELLVGRGRSLASYLYIYVDTLAGGSLVINGWPHAGVHGNSGAVGSMPMQAARDGVPQQLLSIASLVTLEQRYEAAGLASDAMADERAIQQPWLPLTQAWLAEAANAIAYAICSAACLIDLDGVVVDGRCHRALLTSLLALVEQELGRYNWAGAARPALQAGEVGDDAKVIGAAYLSLHASFAPLQG
ncbi:ROK family transcriptional regulator [Duganella margarita]|nr:ROK family transcriptional regulator [Duganella margarita]